MPQTIQLLLLCWLMMFGIVHEWSQRTATLWSWRISFLFASVAWGTTLVAITEFLSLLHLFQREALLTAWISVFLTGGLLYAWLVYRRVGFPLSVATVRLFAVSTMNRRTWNVAEGKMVRPARWINVMLVFIGFQVLTLAMVAYRFAPSNWDAMSYHLARVVHWQQAQSVHHYASHVSRQNQMPPFASFVMAHLHTLTVGDQFVNLVQWYAMVLCLVGVAEIARQLGADRTRQVIAVLVCVSIPMGILQAASTQNDYVVAAWLVCFVALGMNALRNVRQWSYVIGTGLALGLALLTKSSAFVYAPPFAVIIGLVLLYRLRGTALIRGIVILVLVLAVNAGHFTRNTLLYGSPTGPRDYYRNRTLSVNVLASNFIRSTAVHLPLETGISILDRTNHWMLGWLRLLHEFTGLDPADPRTTPPDHWVGRTVFTKQMSFYEADSGNPLHAILIIMTTSIGAVSLWNRLQYSALGYMIVLLSAFLLFCAYLKLSEFRVRLHLPAFVLWCPVIALALFNTSSRLVLSIPILVVLFGCNWTFNNPLRPINPGAVYAQVPRTNGYFARRPYLLPMYREIVDRIIASTCTEVGLIVNEDSWEYPLWMLLREQNYQGVIRHIRVGNASQVYERTDFYPCAIISAGAQSGYTNLVEQRIGGFYVYLDPAMAAVPDVVPEGFLMTPDLGVLVGSGWYDFEPAWNVRWMKEQGQLWVYAPHETEIWLKLQPYVMHVDQTFGSSGQLSVKVNQSPGGKWTVQSGVVSVVPLHLNAGFNNITLTFMGGSFVPEGDGRSLAIAFHPIEIIPIDSVVSSPPLKLRLQ